MCRAFVEHGMHKRRLPVKLWYLSSFFRHERAQAGRFRQFWQVGAEVLGSEDPAVDAESIALLGVAARRARRAPTCACASRASGAPRRAREYRERLRVLPARQRGLALAGGARAHRPQPSAGVRLRRSGHARGDGGRAAAARPPERRGRRALRRGARAAGHRERRLRDRPDAGARGSTTTRARSSSSPPTPSARRAGSAAGGATTASSSSSAARRRPGWAGRRESSG